MPEGASPQAVKPAFCQVPSGAAEAVSCLKAIYKSYKPTAVGPQVSDKEKSP